MSCIPQSLENYSLKKNVNCFSLTESCTFTDTNEVISVNPSTITNKCKYSLITGQAPEKCLNFPAKVYKDNLKKSGEMRRFCLHKWFHDYKFMAYSNSFDGLFCLARTLFPMAAHQGSKAKLLISQPYLNWKDAWSNLNHNLVLQYHKDLMEALKSFVACFQNPNRSRNPVMEALMVQWKSQSRCDHFYIGAFIGKENQSNVSQHY